ncbi:hypothetical protein OAR16_00550 [bacterium]|nr:hypothetical protein [bacterium]
MSLCRLIRLIRKAFQIESEEDLAYLFGKKINEIEYMKLKKPKYSGFFLRSLVFFASLLSGFKFKNTLWEHKSLLIFAGTDNQFNSLKLTIEALDSHQVGYVLILGKKLSKKNIQTFPQGHLVSFRFIEILLAVLFYVRRGISLYFKLKKQNRQIEIDWRFNIFCQAYVFVPYFINLLRRIQPGLVVMSNDHNADNRSLRLASEVLEIKTLYMQHASVSDVFPPLEFDYALLDGRAAHETYLHCYDLQKGVNPRIDNNVARCQVILSGQKKPVVLGTSFDSPKKDCLGLAVNNIDDYHCVEALLGNLTTMNIQCIVRTHPYQNSAFIKQLKVYIHDNAWLTWSNSRKERLADYFSKISAIIAGNTSIHLEAALAGLATIYYELSDNIHRPDYYGYVKNGVSVKLEQGFTLDEIENAIEDAHSPERNQAIKYFSETYGTAWQNREGELTACVIEKVLNNDSFDEILKYEASSIYKSVMSLN